MSGFVDAERVARPETKTMDGTIGVTRTDELVEHALLDVNRLRRGLIEFDEQVSGAENVSLSLIRHDDHTDLALVDPNSDLAVVVAGRVREDGDQA